jgi:hypothetical protein
VLVTPVNLSSPSDTNGAVWGSQRLPYSTVECYFDLYYNKISANKKIEAMTR